MFQRGLLKLKRRLNKLLKYFNLKLIRESSHEDMCQKAFNYHLAELINPKFLEKFQFSHIKSNLSKYPCKKKAAD